MPPITHAEVAGRWKCTKQEKFDDYLGSHGIGYVTRKIVNQVPCVVEFVKNEDGTWTCNEITKVRTGTNTYAIGVRHSSVHPVTLKVVPAVIVEEDGKIVGKGFASDDSDEVVEWTSRELLDDGKTMYQIIQKGDLQCRRWFVRE